MPQAVLADLNKNARRLRLEISFESIFGTFSVGFSISFPPVKIVAP